MAFTVPFITVGNEVWEKREREMGFEVLPVGFKV
jgi:hypothetical protein